MVKEVYLLSKDLSINLTILYIFLDILQRYMYINLSSQVSLQVH